jgi:hypothetical protein
MTVDADKYLEIERKIDEGFVVLISRVNILALMAEGLENVDSRSGMALSEMGRQLDQQARQLLDDWETYATRRRAQSSDPPHVPDSPAGHGQSEVLQDADFAKRGA